MQPNFFKNLKKKDLEADLCTEDKSVQHQDWRLIFAGDIFV